MLAQDSLQKNNKMKQIASLIIAMLFFVCSCGLKNNTNKQNQQWDTGNYDVPEDSDEVATNTENDLDFDFKLTGITGSKLLLFLTTADKNSYYLYDDEADYSNDVFYCYLLLQTIEDIDKEKRDPKRILDFDAKKDYLQASIDTYSPYLKKVFDLPNINNVPPALKEMFLKLYYDHQDSKIYSLPKKYGEQLYRIDRSTFVKFKRYKKESGDGLDDIPDGAIMVDTSEPMNL
jgi:hypothetical protein